MDRPVSQAPIESVTNGNPVTNRTIEVGNNNNVFVALVLDQFSDKISGTAKMVVQGSNDGQNWSLLGSITTSASDAGTQVSDNIAVSTRLVRFVTTAAPANNTVSFAASFRLSTI